MCAGIAAGMAGLLQTFMMALASAAATSAWQISGTPKTFYGVLCAATVLVQLWFWPMLGMSRKLQAQRPRNFTANPELVHDLLEEPSTTPPQKPRAVRFAD